MIDLRSIVRLSLFAHRFIAGHRARCMKEERIPSGHALSRSPGQAYLEYMEEKMRSNRRISTRTSFKIEICPVFRENDLLALTLNRLCHSALGGAHTPLALRATSPILGEELLSIPLRRPWQVLRLAYARFTVLSFVPSISVSRLKILMVKRYAAACIERLARHDFQ